MDLHTLKLSEIAESPTNPREDFDQAALAELAADITLRGLLQPILVRKQGKGYEIIVGHRRARAAALADLKTIPAIVCEMTDQQAEEAQVTENEKRDNLKPLEKAKGYAGLMRRHGLSADDLALKLGKSRSTVYATLRLNELLEHGRKALREGHISESTAKLIARIPASQQVKATKEIVGTEMTYRQALDHVQREYMLDLRHALFDRKDGAQPGGACTSCEKRTGAQPGLFDGEKVAADLCTDSECWGQKLRLHAAAEATKKGVELLDSKDAEKVFSKWGDLHGDEYVSAEAVCREDAKERKYGQLLKPEQVKTVAVLAVTPRGDVVELLRHDGLKQALEDAGKLVKRPKAPKPAQHKPSAETEAMKAELEAKRAAFIAAYPAALAALRAAVAKKASDKKLLGLMVRQLWRAQEYTGDRYGAGRAYYLEGKEFDKHFGSFTAGQLFAVLFELAFDEELGLADESTTGQWDPKVLDVAKLLGVDLKRIAKDVEAKAKKDSTPEQEAEARAAGAVKKPKAAKSAKKKAA